MGIMDKFSTVEIKADNRISDADRAFCVRHQEAFDKSGPALLKIADMIASAKSEQETVLASEGEFYNPYMTSNSFCCDEDAIYEMMMERNKTFISTIVSYFASNYKVELDKHEIMEHLIPEAPQEPKLPWGGYRKMTDEEIDAFKKELSAYKVKVCEHESLLRSLPLRYEQIVDEIFVQLGGFSFQERAMNEFLSKCWDAAHTQRWNEPQPKEDFEIKNDTLRLTGYWCRCRDDSWRSYPEWESTESLKVILNALVHFDIGQLNRGAEWFPELFSYSTKKNLFLVNNLEKVKQIKLFKNGRVDIKFKDSVSVREFVENYLRKPICQSDY